MRARCPLVASILALTLTLAAPLVADAQPADAQAATTLFQLGREAAKRGDYATAIAKMQESYKLDPALGTLLNLADAHEHLGHVATAWQLFTKGQAELPAGDDRRPAVEQRIAAVAPRVPRLTIKLATGTPPDARLTRDGTAIAASDLGVPIPIDPGPHEITITASGRDDRRYTIDVVERGASEIVVEASAVSIAVAVPPRASRGGKLRIAGFAVGGAGLAGIGVAIATGLILPARQKTVDAHCGAAVGLPENRCDATGFDAATSGKSLAGINTVAWIAGGLAVATGVTLVIVGSVGREQPAAAIELRAAPGFAGATIGGSF